MARSNIRRTLPFVLGLGLGLAAGRISYRAVHLTQLMILGRRRPPWRAPSEVGLAFEEVAFAASDGVGLRGWFIRRAGDDGRRAPAVVLVHGWPWCRSGNLAGTTLIPDRTVDFLGPARALHQAGLHVLLFDLRNHGTSDAAPPVTFGVHEARDFAGAVAFLRRRPEVDGAQIGALGYSMGANTLLYGIPESQPIRAAVAVQPVRIATFARNASRDLLGPLGPALLALAKPLHQAFGAPALATIDPTPMAERLGETAMLYIQGDGDPWGTLDDVRAIVARTPNTQPLVVAPSSDRYGGYLYVNNHPAEIVEFFRQYLQ
jgi:dienelactone hydrolase